MGQERLAARLRRCPAPGVERPTPPTHLAYAKRGNPTVVWLSPVTPSQERANSTAGVGRRKKRRPAAERHGESITRRIAPIGVTRKGADVRLAIDPKAVGKELQPGGKVHIPPNYVVERGIAHRKPPEVRICRLRNQSLVGTRPPSTSTPH